MELTGPAWRKSSRSGGDGGHCVELAPLAGAVGIRDSKHPTGGHLAVSRSALADLVDRIKAGDLTL